MVLTLVLGGLADAYPTVRLGSVNDMFKDELTGAKPQSTFMSQSKDTMKDYIESGRTRARARTKTKFGTRVRPGNYRAPCSTRPAAGPGPGARPTPRSGPGLGTRARSQDRGSRTQAQHPDQLQE